MGKKRVAKRISGEKIVVVKQRPQFSKKRQNHSLKASKGQNRSLLANYRVHFPTPAPEP